ncbi:MAG: hypothetical protein ABIH23_03090 [bacterium]
MNRVHIFVAIFLFVGFGFIFSASTQPTAERTLSIDRYTPGLQLKVQILATGDPGPVTVVEIPPLGWTIDRALLRGVVDAGVVTWELTSFSGSARLRYDVTPPLDATGDAAFSGKVGDTEIGGTTAVTQAQMPLFRFGTPMNLGSIVNSSNHECSPCISADGLSLFFGSDRPGGSGDFDLWVTTRAAPDAPWSEPVNLGPSVNSANTDYTPSLSSDGLRLYFARGAFGSGDIWITTRTSMSDLWGAAENLGPVINTWAEEATPSVSADGLSLFFRSTRSGGFGNTDIWVATRPTVQDTWGPPRNLGSTVNSSAYDCGVNVSADGLSLFIQSNRDGGFGSFDLYLSTRKTTGDEWSAPVNLGGSINTSNWDVCPSLSADNRWLYFCDSPFGDPVRPGGFGNADLWQASVEPVSGASGHWELYR